LHKEHLPNLIGDDPLLKANLKHFFSFLFKEYHKSTGNASKVNLSPSKAEFLSFKNALFRDVMSDADATAVM
jgi:hypothetical protein